MINRIGQRLQFRLAALLCAAGLLTACGFQLRGSYTLPYDSLYIAGSEYSTVIAGLKRNLRGAEGTRLASSAQDAQATFLPTAETRDVQILSLSASGTVREKRLVLRYGYRIVDVKGRDLVLPGTVELFRDQSYSDSNVLAKTQEEALLWRDMENDLIQQLMRRLATAKPTPPSIE